MIQSKQSINRMLIISVLVCLLILVTCDTALFAATSSLQQIRCHRYEEGGLPVKVRLSLDFSDTPERLTLKKADNPFDGVPAGFLKDFTIVTVNQHATHALAPANINYGNADGTVNLSFAGNAVNVAVLKGYELKKSEFKYLDDSNVAYVDMRLAPRTVMPTRPSEVIHDTIFVEKIVHDTVYIEKAGAGEVVHDTVFVENVVYVEKGDDVNKLMDITCENFLHWWNDPHLNIDFKFKENTEKLAVKESKQNLKDTPSDYQVQYVIYSENRSLPTLFDDVPVNYIRCGGKVLLMPTKNKCYLLAREGFNFKPHLFTVDDSNRISCLRLSY